MLQEITPGIEFGVSYPLTSEGFREPQPFEFQYDGKVFFPGQESLHWVQSVIEDLAACWKGREAYVPVDLRVHLKRFFGDSTAVSNGRILDRSGRQKRCNLRSQTSNRVIERCILMTTDPGDLVLDPTCGSGTTAYVAEQWGRRWITIDTSRVALALARARIMGARYPYYLLADSPEGQRKEAEISRRELSEAPTYGNLRQGFVYERVPHVTLRAIANNAEIDVIWEHVRNRKLEPLREELNRTLDTAWEEWEIPRETDEAGHGEPRKRTAAGGNGASPGSGR